MVKDLVKLIFSPDDVGALRARRGVVDVVVVAAEAVLLVSFNADYRRRVHAHLLTGVNDTGNY
jgi:hypothetical protein